MSAPAARTNIDRFWLEALDARPALRGAVVDALGHEHLDRVRHSSRLAWTPLAEFEALRRPVLEQLGEDGFAELMRELTLSALEHPLFQALGESVMRLYGRSPAPLLGGFARIWGVLFRGCGKYRCLPAGDERGQVRIAGAPAEVHDQAVIRLLYRGMFAAIVEIGGGTAPEVSARREGDDLVFDVVWRS